MTLAAPSVAGLALTLTVGPLALIALVLFAVQLYASRLPKDTPWGWHCLRGSSAGRKYSAVQPAPQPSPQPRAGASTLAAPASPHPAPSPRAAAGTGAKAPARPARDSGAVVVHVAPAGGGSTTAPVLAPAGPPRPRVEPYSLQYWFHRIGLLLCAVVAAAMVDPVADIGLYGGWTVRLINTWGLFAVWLLLSAWHWFAVLLLYRDAGRSVPPRAWLYVLVALPFVYLIGTNVLSLLPLYTTQRRVWDLPSALSFCLTVAAYSVLLPLTYFRVRSTLRSFLESVKRTAGGTAFDTSHIERGLTTLSRFTLAVTLLTGVGAVALVITVVGSVQTAVDDPNAPPPPPEARLYATGLISTALLMIVLYAALWYSWVPLRFAGAPTGAYGASVVQEPTRVGPAAAAAPSPTAHPSPATAAPQ